MPASDTTATWEANELVLPPEPRILIESLRDIGYSFNSAVADIIDNSISAKASRIWIQAIPDDNFRIGIIDDGEGLGLDDLRTAMRLGSTDPRLARAETDLGRFGLGLKTASFSQCRRVTVASRRDGKTSAFTWDLDHVAATNDWMLLQRFDYGDIPFIEYLGERGTLVLWEKVDRLTGSRGSGKADYARVISEAQDYLSLVFHRFIAGEQGLQRVEFRVNNRVLEAIDPFNTKHKATQSSPVETIMPGVTMQAFTLPHRSHYDSQREYDYYGLEGGYLRNQGIYLYRAKRLIKYGTWYGLSKRTALTQLTRVKIDIDVNQDELWKIDVKKVSAQLPEAVRERIKALIVTIGAPSKRTYKRRASRLTSPEAYPTWSMDKSNAGTRFAINRDNPVIKALSDALSGENASALESVLALIESTLPVEAMFYQFAQSDGKVEQVAVDDNTLSHAAHTFFASFKQQGFDEERILSIMRSAEPFASQWEETLNQLGIEEK